MYIFKKIVNKIKSPIQERDNVNECGQERHPSGREKKDVTVGELQKGQKETHFLIHNIFLSTISKSVSPVSQ